MEQENLILMLPIHTQMLQQSASYLMDIKIVSLKNHNSHINETSQEDIKHNVVTDSCKYLTNHHPEAGSQHCLWPLHWQSAEHAIPATVQVSVTTTNNDKTELNSSTNLYFSLSFFLQHLVSIFGFVFFLLMQLLFSCLPLL